MKKDSTPEGQRQCDAFNAANPIGASVRVRKDCGALEQTV